MSAPVLRVAWYRFRTTLHDRWSGYLVVVLLVGLLGGLAMGAVAGARRTQSAFPNYLSSSSASDLQVQISTLAQTPNTYSPALASELSHLPHVRAVTGSVQMFVAPLKPNGAADLLPALNDNDVATIGSVSGEFFGEDRVAVAQGRMANPARADEFVATVQAARLLGWRVGEVVPLGVFTYASAGLSGMGTAAVQPSFRISGRLVGLVVFNKQVVRDEVDQYPTFVLFTPAFTRRLPPGASFYPEYEFTLDQGSRYVAAVEEEIIQDLRRDDAYTFHVTSVVAAQAERATKPESIALGVFGLMAALAALLIGAQAISRQLQSSREGLEVLRALGADPAMTTVDGLPGTLGAVALGCLIAVGFAIVLSPFMLIGPVRQLEPSPGVSFDWTVLGLGFAVLIGVLSTATIAMARRNAPHRLDQRRRLDSTPASSVVRAAAAAGMPAAAVTGLRFALERGAERAAAPVRSALLGAVLAVAVVASTLTFGSGLSTLVSQPKLYGWNWSYEIEETGGGSFPAPLQYLLNADSDVTWSGFNEHNVQIDGQTIPVLIGQPRAALTPPILAGHALLAANQIVLGAATMAQLHEHIGGTVTITYGAPKDFPVYMPPTHLKIVGTATMPAVGTEGQLHVSMGTGALAATEILPPAFRKALTNPDPLRNGWTFIFAQLRNTTAPAAGLASLQRIASAVNKRLDADAASGGGSAFSVLSVQQPAEILSYRATGDTPARLAGGLAAGTVVALGLTLAASVRRRRRDLALLKMLGFTRRQLRSTVAWQASVAAVIGVIVGLPLGIAAGRWLWTLFAREIYAVPQPTVPALQIALVALGALVLANVAAALPGRSAARTRTAVLLREE